MYEIFGVFGVEWEQLIIQVLNFTLIAFILWRYLYTPLIELIEKRREETIKAVAHAERIATELREAEAKRKEILSKAAMEAEEMLAQARTQAKAQAAALLQEAQARAARIVEEAETRAETLKRAQLEASKSEIAKLVVLGIEKVLRKGTPAP